MEGDLSYATVCYWYDRLNLIGKHHHHLPDLLPHHAGLVKYRDFVKAVDIMLEAPGSAGFSPHAADSSPSKLAIINKSASPTIGRAGSRTSAGVLFVCRVSTFIC